MITLKRWAALTLAFGMLSTSACADILPVESLGGDEGEAVLLTPEASQRAASSSDNLVELITPEQRPAQANSGADLAELITPVIPEKPEEITPVTPEKIEEIVPVTPEVITPVTPEKPEEVTPVTPENPEVVTPITPEKPEVVTPVTPENPEVVTPITPEKPEIVTPVNPENPEVITPVTPENPEVVTPITPEKPEIVTPTEPETSEEAVAMPKLASFVVRGPSETKPTGTISGTVAVEADKTVAVTLRKKGETLGITKHCTAASPDFTFSGLEPGEYTLTLSYVGISGPVLTLTEVVSGEAKTNITITSATAGENKLVIKGTAKPLSAITVGSVPTSSETTVVSDSAGSFTAEIVCAAKTYTSVWAQYAADLTTRVSLAGKFVVTDEETGEYPTLYRGDRYNPWIYRLQQRLKDLGYYSIRVDGIFGSGTERAVRLFQQVNGLSATGIATSHMQQVLYSKDAKSLYDRMPEIPDSALHRSPYYQAAVVPLQRRLRELGYYTGSVDGYFGSGTYRAVRNFQSRNGLSVTGVADYATQKKLYSSSAKHASGSSGGSSYSDGSYRLLYWGCTGDSVRRLQRALINAGYTQVRTVDGIYGKWTYDAVRAFQRDHGLSVDGIAGRKTQNVLYGTSY